MRSGELRHQVELQSAAGVSDGMGGTTDTYSTQATVWAAIWPLSAKEAIRAGAPTMVGMHNVRIRYYPGLSAAWRVKYGSWYFSIVSIANKDERNVYQDLLCREVLP